MRAVAFEANDGRGFLEPLDTGSCAQTPAFWTAERVAAATWAFVALGVFLRGARYALKFPLWGDEAFLSINLIERGYGDMLRRLDYGQICAVGFLWIQLTLVKLFGFNEWSLRAFPMVCSVASLLLFRRVATRILTGLPLVLAVGILAVSGFPIRLATDAKPYASDLLMALVVLAPALEWWRAQEKTGWLWVLAGVTPLALTFSHPAIFVASGLVLGLVFPVWKSGRWRVWLPFLVYLAAIVVTFLLLYMFVTRTQSQGTLQSYRKGYWAQAFPPLDRPLQIPSWFLSMNTGNMFAYPEGGPQGSSSVTTLCFVVAVVAAWRRGRRALVLALVGPFLMALVAAGAGRYPYGQEARQMQFLAPAICLFAGLGAAIVLQAVTLRRVRPWAVGAFVVFLPVLGLEQARKDYLRPYRFRSDQQARDFAKQFWPALERDAEVAAARPDLQITNRRSMNLRTALHACNLQIYSPSHRERTGPRWDRVTADHPMRCVLYHETPPRIPEVVQWLARMKTRYDVRSTEWVDVNMSGVSAGPRLERWCVIELVPKGDQPIAGAGRKADPAVVR